MNSPPLGQLQVQYPIIDDLADEFALLIDGVAKELHSLSHARLNGLKASIEEKLRLKSMPITMPTSAEELMSSLSKFWDFHNFELAQFVVRYLGTEELQTRMQIYKGKLQKRAEILLTHCRVRNITPRAPPGCDSMKMTVGGDPHSYSLHRILEMRDFLVSRIRMTIALFAGWSPGSIIQDLHFYVLEDDMETAVCLLKEHKLQLGRMQVVAIEVGDKLVYQDMVSDDFYAMQI